jgi:hypothetical protein
MLKDGAKCWQCGRRATELDHVPPLKTHKHREGSGCCRSRPSCAVCARAQGGELSHSDLEIVADLIEILDPEPSPGKDDSVWDVPWLDVLRRKMPRTGVWPRFMSQPHPSAVDSYGADAIRWLEKTANLKLRWWQQLALTRLLEHDVNEVLVWIDILVSTSRQSGKSVLLRAIALWRLHQELRFKEAQQILHIARDLRVANAVQRPARAWAMARNYDVRLQAGSERIALPDSENEWIIKSSRSMYGYAASLALCDEAWGLLPEAIEDGVEPVLLERRNPQLLLTSTAHGQCTSLVPTRRTLALEEMRKPVTTLIIEWSAAREADISDRKAWRAASPHWSPGRERLLEARLRRVQSGESIDEDESDPVSSFKSQYLNQWPLKAALADGEALVDRGVWMSARLHGEAEYGRMWVGVESDYGRGAAVAAVAELGSGMFEIDGWLCDSVDDALADAVTLITSREQMTILVVGPSLIVKQRCEHATAADVRFGLPLIRHMVENGRLVHDVTTSELDSQITAVKVKQVSGGLALIAGTRSDIVRAASWALRSAVVRRPAPAIH